MSTAAVPRDPKAGSPMRWLLLPPLAALIVLLMVLVMRWMIVSPHVELPEGEAIQAAQIIKAEAPKPTPPDQDAAKLPDLAPPPPPDAPPSLARPNLPAIATSSIPITAPTVAVANIGVGDVNLGEGMGLGRSGVFGGFAGGGGNVNGNGGGGGGGGRGNGAFAGRELVPLSTARPQMPPWACKQKIRGWVEVVFVVTTAGKVENVRIVDAQPRGVYEAAAIESVGNWIYPKGGKLAEVKQRVEMDPADCAYNYNQ